MVKVLAQLDRLVPVDRQALSDSVAWLIRQRQQPDGSFRDTSAYSPHRVLVRSCCCSCCSSPSSSC